LVAVDTQRGRTLRRAEVLFVHVRQVRRRATPKNHDRALLDGPTAPNEYGVDHFHHSVTTLACAHLGPPCTELGRARERSGGRGVSRPQQLKPGRLGALRPNRQASGETLFPECEWQPAIVAIRKLVLYEAPVGFVKASPDVVDRLHAVLESGQRDDLLALFLREVAGLPPDQIELMRSLPAWEARLAAAQTIPREERVNREYVFEAGRFREVGVPTLLLEGGDSADSFSAANQAILAALPDCRLAVMPGQRHVAMDTGPDVFMAEVLSFLEATV
jgi:pimeloyl-ACP methyl ester carboxylesterase